MGIFGFECHLCAVLASMSLHKFRIGRARILINNIPEYFSEVVKRRQWLHIVLAIVFSVALERKYVFNFELCL